MHRQAGMSATSSLGLKACCMLFSPTGLYRFTVGATAWTRMNANVPIDKSFMPMAASKGTLYIVSADEIFYFRR